MILITGGLGWLGKGLVHALVNGLPDCPGLHWPLADQPLRVMVQPGQDPTLLLSLSERVEVFSGDIRVIEDCTGFCAGAEDALLLHTAGIIHPRRVREFYEINLEGTKKLLDAAANAHVKRAVVVSSNSPCGCNPHPDHLFDEESPYHPYMHYGRSKMLMELAVKKHQDAGSLETVLIRAPWFYGSHQPPRQTQFFRMIRDGRVPIAGDGNNLRSMAYIDNLCQGLILAGIEERAKGQVYWVADENPYTMNEIVDTIEHLLETEFSVPCVHKRLRLPNMMSEMALFVDKILQGAGFYHQKIHVLSEMNKTIACSVDKARQELGYRPGVALEEGMRRSLRWMVDTFGEI